MPWRIGGDMEMREEEGAWGRVRARDPKRKRDRDSACAPSPRPRARAALCCSSDVTGIAQSKIRTHYIHTPCLLRLVVLP